MRAGTPDIGLYFPSAGTNQVLGYVDFNRQNNGPACTIAQALDVPAGSVTDANRNLYVANYGSSTISKYGPGCGAQIGASVSDPYGKPTQIALNGKTWYVGNQSGNPGGNIAVCSASGCSADLTMSGKNAITTLIGVALDINGNVYASYLPAGFAYPELAEFPLGSMPGHVIKGYRHRGVLNPGPLEFDNNGNLISTTGVSIAGSLYVYSGCPTACTSHGPFALKGQPVDFTLNKANTELFVADYYGPHGFGEDSIDVYKYSGTAGVTYKYSITSGLNPGGNAFGIAVVPPPVP